MILNLTKIVTIIELIYLTQTYIFKNGHRLMINSSYNMDDGNIYLTISSSNPKNQSQKFYFYCPQITQSKHPISMFHTDSFLGVDPPIPHAKIIQNYIKQNQNILRLVHPYNFHSGYPMDKNTNFIVIQILSGKQQQDFLIPLMNLQMSFIPAHSFYFCQGILIGVDVSRGRQDVSIYSRSPVMHLQGNWSWKLVDHGHAYFQKMHFCRFSRPQTEELIRINLHGNYECQVDPSSFGISDLDVHQFMNSYSEKHISLERIRHAAVKIQAVQVQPQGNKQNQQL